MESLNLQSSPTHCRRASGWGWPWWQAIWLSLLSSNCPNTRWAATPSSLISPTWARCSPSRTTWTGGPRRMTRGWIFFTTGADGYLQKGMSLKRILDYVRGIVADPSDGFVARVAV